MNERDSLLILDSSYERMMDESMRALEGTPISNRGPGSTVRLLLSIVNRFASEFYGTLKREHAQAFLSRAKDENVDLLGEALSCLRMPGETDDAYKYRISNQTLTLERANETAVRLAALSVEKVINVVMRPFATGAGSFAVYPVLDDPYDPDFESVMREMAVKLDEVKAYGVRATVLEPRLSRVELKGYISFGSSLNEVDRRLVQDRVTRRIREYIGELMPGDAIRINAIHRIVMDEDTRIADVEIYQFAIDGRAMLLVDQQSPWNVRFVEADGASAISFR